MDPRVKQFDSNCIHCLRTSKLLTQVLNSHVRVSIARNHNILRMYINFFRWKGVWWGGSASIVMFSRRWARMPYGSRGIIFRRYDYSDVAGDVQIDVHSKHFLCTN